MKIGMIENLYLSKEHNLMSKEAWHESAFKIFELTRDAISSYAECKGFSYEGLDYGEYILCFHLTHIVWSDLNFDTISLDKSIQHINQCEDIDSIIKNVALSSLYILKSFPPYESCYDYGEEE